VKKKKVTFEMPDVEFYVGNSTSVVKGIVGSVVEGVLSVIGLGLMKAGSAIYKIKKDAVNTEEES